MSCDNDELSEDEKAQLKSLYEITVFPKRSEYELWKEAGDAEFLKKIGLLRRKSCLVHSRSEQNRKRMEKWLRILRWLAIHRHSSLKILAYMLKMQPDSVRNICKKMVEQKLLIKRPFGFHGRHEFMIYGITKAGLNYYYGRVETPLSQQLKRVFSVSEGIEGSSEHDYALQWVQADFEEERPPPEVRCEQHWVNDGALPDNPGRGKRKTSKSWPKYPDGVLYNSPYAWVDTGFMNQSVIGKKHLYDQIEAAHELIVGQGPGYSGYLNVAIEIERINKNKPNYKSIIRRHEINIETGRYDLVIYYSKTLRKSKTLEGYITNHIRSMHEPKGRIEIPEYAQQTSEKAHEYEMEIRHSWRKKLRAFQFLSYENLVDQRTPRYNDWI